jgi:diaminopimelate epimerase
MCGNGGRCLTRFAADMGILKSDYTFWRSTACTKLRLKPMAPSR